MQKFWSRQKLIALAVGTLLAGGGFLYYQLRTPAPKTVVTPPPKIAEVKKPRVKLEVVVTNCEKMDVTIPTEAGFLTQSSDVAVIRGYVENRGEVPVQFVQIQLYWQNEAGKFIDYDDVFAVSAETLLPGGKAPFQMSKRNSLIEKCSAKLLDWWVVRKSKKPPEA